MKNDPDLDLLPGFRAGHGTALSALMDRHLDRVHALAWHMTGDRAQAEDVAQETFLRFWQAAPKWKATGEAKISTWLLRVATRICIDAKRKKRPVYLDVMPDAADSSISPHLELVRSESATRVQAALMDLPERQRAAIVLSYYQDMSQADGASALGVRQKAYESLLSRAKTNLRTALQVEKERDVI